MSVHYLLFLLFALSGAAGLIYESTWTRYLGLFVGHDAYAQIIVLVIFLGGMSAGAMVVSRWSERLRQPLYGYVAAEFLAGCIGLGFHDIFQAVTAGAYQSVYPALAGSWALTAAKWGIASALILPQSVLLGATFPLMSAGVLRLQGSRPGRTLALLYFANSLGAAVGVLVAGFYLVELAGLPGTLLTAAILNLVVAALTVGVIHTARARGDDPASEAPAEALKGAASLPDAAALRRLLLFTAFATAVASFVYEIAWIRMLALVLGSATHSFELMLSAFILGLALGAWWIHSRADGLSDPVRILGIVQWVMGALAMATIPLYLQSFGWIASLIGTFAPTDPGYTGFTLARYGLCLAVMLPATFCAGMTLPLITRTLLGLRSGEAAIGAVYGWNTLGSIVGVGVAGLVLLPAIGLHAMLIAGALVDMGVGVALLRRTGGAPAPGRRAAGLAALAAGLAAVLTWGGARFDPALLSSGVYRTGAMIKPGEREVQFYRDGRTATVSGIRLPGTGYLSLATNGKTDASLPPTWYATCDSALRPRAMGADAATQALLPLVTLAHAPKARTAAVIGQGSGMSSHLLLASPLLDDLVTVEIEPQMIEGSRIFYPANRRAFDDPRSRFVIDDAKSYFASEQRRYDLIMSEPSNPWVSGVSGLFTIEFYTRVRGYLTDTGVFGQWLHLYELDDALVLTVLAALHRTFPSYEVYLVPSGDLLVVASNRPSLPAPDWSVMGFPALRDDLCRFLPLTPATLDALHLVGRSELAPLLEHMVQPNSDYYPVLDLGAERRRFRHDFAAGFPALSTEWFNLVSSLRRRRSEAGAESTPAIPENPRVRARAIGALLRTPAIATAADTLRSPVAGHALYQWQLWRAAQTAERSPGDWGQWLEQAGQVDRLRNSGTAGVADEGLYAAFATTVDRWGAPQPVRDVLAFRQGLAAWNFAEAAAAADRLLPVAMRERRWIGADELRDGVVMARLHLGDVAGARRDLDALAPFSTRKADDLRSQLLEAYVRSVEPRRTPIARR
jgi:predicted membrane-bound spermidine synthase